MSKKFTSFLVLAAAALLLTVPTHAQLTKKAAKQHTELKAGPVKTFDVQKAKDAKEKANFKYVGYAFTGAMHQQIAKATLLETAINKIESDKDAFERLMAENLTSTKLPTKTNVRVFNESVATPLTASASRRAEVIDENGIITTPADGVELTYKRAGTGYYYSGGSVYIGTQSGNVTIVEATDGTVYIKDIISYYASGAWVKGTKSGNTITVPVAQPVNYNTQYTTTLSVNFGTVDAEGNIKKAEAQPEVITFAIDETNKVISLQGTAAYAQGVETTFVGVFWDDDNSFSGFGDAESVWTLKEGEEVATTGANVEAPYSNALNSEAAFADFGVLDSNEDGNTWIFSSTTGATYNYSSSNAADDWLISPAIKLEAGKKYHFAIDAACASPNYPEVFEVLLGTEAKASALSQSVLTATEVASKEYATYENEVVTVAETGYYHFGIHAISDANMWRLVVKNFLVEAGAEATAPAAVTDFAVAQTPDKLEAVVSFKAPAKNVAGEDLTDLTKIDVLRDGAVVKSIAGSAEWVAAAQGYEDSENITSIDLGAGATAALSAGTNTSNAPRYWAADQTLRLYNGNTLTITGNDIKKVVVTFGSSSNNKLTAEGFVVDGTTGTWTGSANEIAFSATAKAFIKSIVIETAGLTPGAEYSVADAEGLTIGTHVYQVIPYNASGAGIKSEEKSVFITVTLEAPYTFDFSQNLLDLFTVVDNNADGKTWTWNESSGVANYSYHGSNDADDYLITLPFNLKAGKRYNVIVNAKGSASYPERMEVLAGKDATVEGLTQEVIAPTLVNTGNFDEYEGVFAPEEDGQYYFAIHAISDADMLNLQVKTLAIEIAPELTAPAAIADLTATPGAEGALEANLAFTAPAKDIKGDALTGNVDVKIYRDNELVNTLEGIAAGAAATWKDTNVENAKTYTYYVVAGNESGDGLKSDKVKVFVGEDTFAKVENIKITGTTASTISFSWDPVTGANGGYVNAAAAKYAVVSTHVETYLFWQYLVVDEVLGTVEGQTSGTFDFDVNAGEQEYKYFGVLAYKEDTEVPAAGEEYAGGYTWALVGAPYDLPFFESFTGSKLHYLWDTNAALVVDQESSDDDGVAVDLLADEAGVYYFQSGKININGTANPTLLFNAKSPNISKLYVYASKNGGEMSPVAAFDLTEDYQTFKVSLANLATNANFVQFALLAEFATPYTVDDEGNLIDLGDYFAIDEIRILDLFEYNLVADIKAPKNVVAGQKAKVVATVTNYGENAAKDYTVTVKAGEKTITSVIGSEELAPFATDEVEVDFETSVFDEAGDVTLSVAVDYENELNPDDNTASTVIIIKEPTAVAPATLAAEDKGADGVELTWAMPAASRAADAVTEDFEATDVFEPFSLGGITAEEHNGAFGDWKLYDGNGFTVYGFNGIEFPNAYQAAAWQVVNTDEVSALADNGYTANSGVQYLWSFCPADETAGTPAADHWLISPELSGDAQTVSFYARAITAQYGAETFEVWASTTSDNVESFEKVAEYTTEAVEWTEFTADLPAGAKYFAIRHTSQDIFGLLVDDVTYAAAGASAPAPTSFNIYVEQDKVASVEGDKTTYTVAVDKLTAGEHTFAVSAVYANGAESKPVTATITVTTDIRQIAADGKAVDIYSVDGKLVRSQATSLDGLKGLYIVNGKKVMVK